ncbi:MAG TPA: cupredoxin family copper-binding protein [Planctomycetota bacterium]|nr:cupredoxin family copper-binding protein [Planctomycetota bacterium]
MTRLLFFSLLCALCAGPICLAQDSPVCNCKPLTVTVRTAAARATDTVPIQNFAFTNDPITINVGDTVTWTNNDSVTHEPVSDTGAFDTGPIAPGQSASFTFTSAGTYSYHCSIHPFMKGTVIVAAPAPPTLRNLTATAKINTPFTYTIAATGAAPIAYNAVVPAGLTLNGAVISGQFTTAGTVTIPLTAANSLGSDAQNLVVTVVASNSNDLSGTWTGKLKSKHFSQIGATLKSENDTVSLTLMQAGGSLSGTLIVTGLSGAASYAVSGETGHTNLWLSGNSTTKALVTSVHLNKSNNTMTGIGIVTNPDGDEEIAMSLKKQ